MSEAAKAFPITVAAFRRLRRNWRLWWAGYHVFAAIDQLEKIGPETDPAVDALKFSFVYKFPQARP